jgi:DNA polymerase III epsilon subunit-like protein
MKSLLADATKVHCIVMYDLDKGELLHLDNEAAIKKLTKADLIVGHNIIKFDIPVLKKIYNFKPRGKVFDTIIATRLLFPDIRSVKKDL